MLGLRRNHKKGTGIGLIAFVVLLLFGIIAYKTIDLEKKVKQVELKIERLNSQVQEQEELAEEINNLKAYVQTKGYIEDIAREKLGLVYEDEIILESKEDE